MLTNRISQWVDAQPNRIATVPEAAFVPLAMAGLVAPDQWERVATIYRLAAERVRQELERQVDSLPRFSLN
jgi:hypothetical protein